MKKMILFFIAVLFAANVSAERGSMVLSGNFEIHTWNNSWTTYGSDSPSENNHSSFSIAPNFQYFLTDRFSLGAEILFGTRNHNSWDNRRNSFGAGVLGRYYFLKNQRFGVFGQANANALFGSNDEADWTRFEARITPGVQYFINNRWSLEAQTTLFRFSSDREERYEASTFNSSSLLGGLNSMGAWFSVNFHF